MTISSYGFPDTIAPGGVWANIHRTAGRLFGFADPAAFRPTNTTTRAIDVQPGALYAHGIYVSSNAAERVSLPNVVSGSQYFLVVADIRWNDDSGGYRTTLGYVPGTAARSIPTRSWSGGVRAQVPIALVRITAGSSTPTEIVDLRGCQTVAGEYQIYDDLALNIYGYVGTTIYNVMTKVQRTRRGTSSFSTAWEVTSLPPARTSKEFAAIAMSTSWSVNPGYVAGAASVLRAFPLGDVSPGTSAGPGDWLVELELVCSYTSPGTPITASSTGALPDVSIATITDARLRPQGSTVTATAYVVTSSNCHGGIAILPNTGKIVLTDLLPSHTIKGVLPITMNPRPEASLRLRTNWVVRDVAL